MFKYFLLVNEQLGFFGMPPAEENEDETSENVSENCGFFGICDPEDNDENEDDTKTGTVGDDEEFDYLYEDTVVGKFQADIRELKMITY